MLTNQSLRTLWLLLLLQVSGEAFRLLSLFDQHPVPREGEVRLVGSGSVSEGRVEIYHEGKWGTVCDDGWDMAEAQVVCRQLNFPGAKSVVIGKDYGGATGPIWLDDLFCEGTEKYLSACTFKSWGLTDCSHKEDVGVICKTGGTNGTADDSTHTLDHSISLSDDLGHMFDSGKGCDFIISARTPTGDKKEDGTPEIMDMKICTHKLIISQFPAFNATEGVTIVTIPISQACQPYFTSFIRYLYTRKIDVTFTSATCIHRMASQYGLTQLMEDTGRVFTKILPEDTSFQTPVLLYKYAEETDDLVLQENCVQYLAWNYQDLTMSPAWIPLPVKLLQALLSRSDLVVPDEEFLLQTVESWIKENRNSTTFETQVDLLNRIRFPMISADLLFGLEVNSSLYSTFKSVYRENMLTGFQFHLIDSEKLQASPSFSAVADYYQPRIYTSETWSTTLGPFSKPKSNQMSTKDPNRYQLYNRRQYDRYGYDRYYYTTPSPYRQTSRSFNTPLHYSQIFKGRTINWYAHVLRQQYECSNVGVRCESLPAARLAPSNYYDRQKDIVFRNQLLLTCQGRYICQIQEFKENLAYVSGNGTRLTYPCPDDQFSYRFVVRPTYIQSNDSLSFCHILK